MGDWVVDGDDNVGGFVTVILRSEDWNLIRERAEDNATDICKVQ